QQTVTYEVSKVPLEGVLLYDDAAKGPRPGVVVVPNWMGITPPNLEQAKLIAGTKYVVFVADMYGKATRPKDMTEAGKAASAVKGDPELMRARIAAALEQLKAHWQLVKYSNSVHSFTDPEAHMPGRAEYNPLTAKRAYAAMNAFFDELFQ